MSEIRLLPRAPTVNPSQAPAPPLHAPPPDSSTFPPVFTLSFHNLNIPEDAADLGNAKEVFQKCFLIYKTRTLAGRGGVCQVTQKVPQLCVRWPSCVLPAPFFADRS